MSRLKTSLVQALHSRIPKVKTVMHQNFLFFIFCKILALWSLFFFISYLICFPNHGVPILRLLQYTFPPVQVPLPFLGFPPTFLFPKP